MSAGRGLLNRDVTMTVGSVTLLGVVTKDVSITNSAVEATDDQSGGFRELLAKGGVKALDLSIGGDVKNYELCKTMFATTQMVECVIDLGDGASTESTLTFDALLSEFSFGGSANEKNEYSASLMSSGAIVFSAGT